MKKFLSLVLALIMTMSLVTISAGATEYKDLTDKDEIEYEEAVAVLNRIGVITGYDDGSFRPETELTRGAAAKIIVSLLIGPEAANNLPNTTAPYPDVPASHTFAGVISYCKTAGIISGYGDGTFKPANSLTGFAFAKMLLGALGYNSQVEGFVDTGWTMNVAKVGNVTGLFDRLDFDGAGAVSREVACQLALNTLKATMVTYGGTTVVTGAQTLAVQGTQAMYVTSNNRDINANINRRVISATNNELTLEFGEEHFKDLRLEHDRYDPAYDIYGHPSNEWSYKKVTIGTFKLPADFTYTKQMAHIEDTQATKEKALGLRGYDTYSTDHKGGYVNWSTAASNTYGNSPFADATQIHINGWKARVWNDDYKQTAVPSGESVKGDGNWYSYDAFDIGAANKTLAPSLSEICDLTDNGVTVEVYVCPVDADFITDVVVTRTQLMEVDRVASDYVELDTISSDSNDPRKAGALNEIAGYNDYSLFDEVLSVKDNNYDPYNVLKDLKSGDEVAVIPYTSDNGKTWEVGEAYVPETVSGALTNVDIYNTRSWPNGNAVGITVGGTTYPIAQWNKDMISISGQKIKATKKDVTLLLDKDGNALLAKDVGASDDWIIVGDYYQAALTSGRVGWYVHGWTIKGDEVDLELGTIRGAAEKYAPGELVRYQVASAGNGEYELVKPMYKTDNPTGNRRVLKNGNLSSWIEPEGDKDKTVQTGQGIYNVAQYAKQGGVDKAYDINSRNTLIPLEFYNTDPSRRQETNAYTAAGVHKNYANANYLTDVESAGNYADAGSETANAFYSRTSQYNTWTYRTTPYDGVKFIFVGFDSANGEVDTINVLDGVQNVEYKELTQINRWWKNVGTNNEEFVASPAEAYVDKNGKVKAVVIKSDSAEANLKDLIIITDNRGTNTSIKGGAEAPTSGTYYTRQYVSGEDGFKEEKTGYFDKPLAVGTVITGRLQSDGIIKSRVFHANEYTDRNPDGFYVQGIKPLKTQEGKDSDWGFYVGAKNGYGDVYYLGSGASYGNGTLAATASILTDKDVLGVDTGYDKQGLIKVDSTTQFLDLRDGRPGDINELADLFDSDKCDNKTAILKVLVNGNESSDGFRHAYAIMILTAAPGKSRATAPTFNITVDGMNAWDAETKTYKTTANVGDTLDLDVLLTNEKDLTNVSYNWSIDQGKLDGDKKSSGVTFTPKAEGTYKVTVVVTNKDTSKEIEETSVTKTLTIVVGKANAQTGKFGIIRNDANSAYVAEVSYTVLSTSSSKSYIDMWVETWPEFLPDDATISGKPSADIGTAVIADITAADGTSAVVLKKGAHTTAYLDQEFTSVMSITDGSDVSDLATAGNDRFTADKVKVRFLSGDTADISKYLAKGSDTATELKTTGAAATDLKAAISTSGTINTTGTPTFTVSGLAAGNVTTPANVNAVTSPKITQFLGAAQQAKGNDYVTVTLYGLGSLTNSYSVAASGKFEVKADGSTAINSSAAKYVSLTATPTSVDAGGSVTVSAAMTNADTGIGGWYVTVTLDGKTICDKKAIPTTDGDAGTFAATAIGTISGITANVDLSDAVVTVEKIAKLAVKEASVTANTVTLTFNRKLDAGECAGLTASAISDAVAGGVCTNVEMVGDNQIRITYTSSLTTGDVISLKATGASGDTVIQGVDVAVDAIQNEATGGAVVTLYTV